MNIRNVNDLTIIKTIVHVIDKKENPRALLSDKEVDMDSVDAKITKFILDHIKKSLSNNESKMSKFIDRKTRVQLQVNEMIKNSEKSFLHSSKLIAQYLYTNSPQNSSPGCIVIVLYKDLDSDENFVALMKLDKNDSILYEKNEQGYYELVLKGSTLPAPSKRTKLLKFATIRNTETMHEDEFGKKPELIILDSQAEEFSQFFYKTFLESEFLLNDEFKSEKLILGLKNFLKNSVSYKRNDQYKIRELFAEKLINGEEFNIDDAAQQILAPFLSPDLIAAEIKRFEQEVIRAGIGDLTLKGIMSAKMYKKHFKNENLKTEEGISLKFPSEMYDTGQITITDSIEGEGKDILIKNVKLIER